MKKRRVNIRPTTILLLTILVVGCALAVAWMSLRGTEGGAYEEIDQPVWPDSRVLTALALLTVLVIVGGSSYALLVSSRAARLLEHEVARKTGELRDSHTRLEKVVGGLQAVKHIGALANQTLDLQEVLQRILSGTLEATGATVGMIFLRNPVRGYYQWGASIGLSEEFVSAYKDRPIHLGEGLTGRIAQSGEPIFIPVDSSHDPRIARPVVTAERLNSFIGVPVRAEGEIVAVMNILTRPPDVLRAEDIEFAAAIGTHVGSAIRNARLFQELGAEKRRLAVMLHSIGDGVIATDDEGRVVLMNDVAEALTLWSEAEAAGKPLSEVFRIVNERTHQPCQNPADRILHDGAVVVGLANDTVLIARDGTERVIADSGAPIIDRDSGVLGVVLVFRDVTQKREVEREMLKASRLESLCLLAGGIAHDFNNLLAGILGYVSLARRASSTGDIAGIDRRLASAEAAVLRAKELTQQLLVFSKGGVSTKKPTAIGGLIKEWAVFAASGSASTCDVVVPEDLWSVDVDAGQIGQVIQNLVINAGQAMPGGGHVEVRVRNVEPGEGPAGLDEAAGFVEISVSDQGVGIPEENLNRVFDPFFTTKPAGSGLGLSVVYSVIRNHGGHVRLESTPGIGTTFHVYLPAAQASPAADAHQKGVVSAGVPGFHGRILLMDDEKCVRDAATHMFALLGYQAVSAQNGTEAVELFSRSRLMGRPFDAVMLDLTVPGGMGAEQTLAAISKIDAGVRAIVSSGYASDPIMLNPREHGFHRAIAKPYDLKQLAALLRDVILPADRERK